MEAFDEAYNDYQEELSKANKCCECGTPIDSDKEFCSKTCYKANMI